MLKKVSELVFFFYTFNRQNNMTIDNKLMVVKLQKGG